MKHLSAWFFGLWLLGSGWLPAQVRVPLAEHYTQRQMGTNPLVWGQTQDARGVLSLATNDGVLQYDGHTWTVLPVDRPRAVAAGASVVYVGGENDLGVLTPGTNGRFTYTSLRSSLSGRPTVGRVERVVLTDEGAVCFSSQGVFRIQKAGTFYGAEVLLTNVELFGGGRLGQETVVFVANQGLRRLVGRSLRELPGAQDFKGRNLAATASTGGTDYLASEDGLYRFTGKDLSAFSTQADGYIRANGGIWELAGLPGGLLAIGVRNGGVVIVDSRGREVQRLTRANQGLPDNAIYSLGTDRQGGLWIGHARGLTRVQPDLPMYLMATNGIESKIADVLPTESNLYVAANQGLLVQPEGAASFSPVAGITRDAWDLVATGPTVLAATQSGVFEVDGSRARLLLPNEAYRIAVTDKGNRAYAGLLRGVAKLDRVGTRWVADAPLKDVDVQVQSLLPLGEDTLLVASATDGLLQIVFREGGASLMKLSGSRGLPEGAADVLAVEGQVVVRMREAVFRATPDLSRFRPDSALSQLLPWGLPVAAGSANRLFLAAPEGLQQARLDGATWTTDSVPVSHVLLQAPTILQRYGSTIWAGLHDQLYTLDLQADFTPIPPTAPVLKQVRLGTDSLLFRGLFRDKTGEVLAEQPADAVPSLPPQLNNLTFQLAPAQFLGRDGLQYQYRVLGLSDEWSAWTTQPEISYSGLADNSYVFEGRVRDVFGQVSPVVRYAFSIQTPIWKTPVALGAYVVLALVLVWMIIRINNARLEARNRQLEEVVLERTKEVNRQKQELEQSNAELGKTLQELHTSQTQLVQSEKMAALGQLVAGVAHEINTPLGAINAAAGNLSKSLSPTLTRLPEMLKTLDPRSEALFFALVERSLSFTGTLTSRDERAYRKTVAEDLERMGVPNAATLAPSLVKIGVLNQFEEFLPLFHHPQNEQILEMVNAVGKLRVNIDNIELAVAKTQKIVFALKSYSHRQAEDQLVPSSLTENMDMVLTIYHNQLKYGVEVTKDYEAGLPELLCFPDELNQVWTNILVNGVQAMEGKGSFRIEIHKAAPLGVPGLEVRMTDSGPGIPPQVAQRVFEPFFTTKKQGEGSGLGLDIVKRIIEKHRGTIHLDTVPGRTTFVVYLPLDPQTAPIPPQITTVQVATATAA